MSGIEPDDEELDEIEELERMTSAAGQDIWTRAKKFVHDFVERVGFFGILVCASVSYMYGPLVCTDLWYWNILMNKRMSNSDFQRKSLESFMKKI